MRRPTGSAGGLDLQCVLARLSDSSSIPMAGTSMPLKTCVLQQDMDLQLRSRCLCLAARCLCACSSLAVSPHVQAAFSTATLAMAVLSWVCVIGLPPWDFVPAALAKIDMFHMRSSPIKPPHAQQPTEPPFCNDCTWAGSVLPCCASSNSRCATLPRREQILARKRQEYRDMVPEYYDVAMSSRSVGGCDVSPVACVTKSEC